MSSAYATTRTPAALNSSHVLASRVPSGMISRSGPTTFSLEDTGRCPNAPSVAEVHSRRRCRSRFRSIRPRTVPVSATSAERSVRLMEVNALVRWSRISRWPAWCSALPGDQSTQPRPELQHHTGPPAHRFQRARVSRGLRLVLQVLIFRAQERAKSIRVYRHCIKLSK